MQGHINKQTNNQNSPLRVSGSAAIQELSEHSGAKRTFQTIYVILVQNVATSMDWHSQKRFWEVRAK